MYYLTYMPNRISQYRSFPSKVYFHDHESLISENQLYRYCNDQFRTRYEIQIKVIKLSRPFNRNNGESTTLKGRCLGSDMLSNFHHKVIGCTLHRISAYQILLHYVLKIADRRLATSFITYRHRKNHIVLQRVLKVRSSPISSHRYRNHLITFLFMLVSYL